MSETFLNKFRRLNLERCRTKFHKDVQDWSEPVWGNAIAGEVGELCNILKKRYRSLTPADDMTDQAVLDEIADIIIYLDLLTAKLGYDLKAVIEHKFNQVSTRVGFEERL